MAKGKQRRAAGELGYELPDFEVRDPATAPTSHYQHDPNRNQLELVEGRRPSSLLCVPEMRERVDEWRAAGYEGASETTKRLFSWWFEEAMESGSTAFRPYWVQREAIETLSYLVEVAGIDDVKELISEFGRFQTEDGLFLDQRPQFQEQMDGTQQVILRNRVNPVDLPPEGLRRFGIKAATGSGKTVVMALVAVWSYFHARREIDSPLSTNFLIVAPNVIVFDRLRVDFENGEVFSRLKLIPPGWQFDLRVIVRGDAAEPVNSGNLFLTNIQQLFGTDSSWSPANPLDALLGRRPQTEEVRARSLLARIRSVGRLVVMNDEAHHVHDDDLKWNQTLLGLAGRDDGMALWLDFSATPKDQAGTYFPWTVTDYPLAQAVEDGIVKTPLILRMVDKADPTGVTGANAVAKYGDWITAGVERLRTHEQVLRGLPSAKPVMFLMCESVKHADAIGKWLVDPASGFGLAEDEVLVIHTDAKGEIKKNELDDLRERARRIDDPASPVKIVVSVLVLREGWDVRNVTVVLGLRPGTAEARILPEQAVGRGLRLMPSVGPGQRQMLEVMGTPAFEDFVRELETEGVAVGSTRTPPKLGVRISPVRQRKRYDIAIPRTGAILERTYRRVNDFAARSLAPCLDADDIARFRAVRLEVEDAVHGGTIGDVQLDPQRADLPGEFVATIVNRARTLAQIGGEFELLVPEVRAYLAERCFGEVVDLEGLPVRRFLSDPAVQEKIAAFLARDLGELAVERVPLQVKPNPILMSATPPFLWRREAVNAKKTVFNMVATYNPFESAFAQFLDSAVDVKAFAALAEHFTEFGVSYVKSTGALGTYFPDFVVDASIAGRREMWIVETKGRVWEGTERKDEAMQSWCDQISGLSGEIWSYIRVDQDWWDRNSFGTMEQLLAAAEERSGLLDDAVVLRAGSSGG